VQARGVSAGTWIFVQARMGSRRLPGKVLEKVCGLPLLEHIIGRLRRVRAAEGLMVLTSTADRDLPVYELAARAGVPAFRGSEDDVLDRFYGAAREARATTIVRVTGDCPLIDPELVDDVIAFFASGGWDYVSNTILPTYPDGLDTEVFSFEALSRAWKGASSAHQREHVTPHFYENPDRFRIANYRSATDHSAHRWIVDEADDLAMVRAVYERLYPQNNAFTTGDVFELLEREPAIRRLNDRYARNEGFFRRPDPGDDGSVRTFATWNDYISDIFRRKGCSISETTGA